MVTQTWLFHQESSGTSQVKSFSTFPILILILIFSIVSKLIVKISNADVGPQRPATFQPFKRRQPVAPVPAPQDESTEFLAELEGHLERLTGDIPETTIDDIPRRLQCYVIGVPGPFRRFVCKVARAMVSYIDHH